MPRRKIDTPTEGQRLLAKFIAEGRNQTDISTALRAAGATVSQPAVHFWSTGAWRPMSFQRVLLHHLLGIPAEAWLTPEERAVVDALPTVSADDEEDLLEWRPLHSTKTATKN